MWRAAGLEEKAGSSACGAVGGSANSGGAVGGAGSSTEVDTEVDNSTAAGVFARLGRDASRSQGEHAGVNLGTHRMAASPAASS